MNYEVVCRDNKSIITFPLNDHMTEMLRVTSGGQVMFNYQQWELNTATDLFFRTLAQQVPELCTSFIPDLNEQLTTCTAEKKDLTLDLAFMRTNYEKVVHTNQALAQKTTGVEALFCLGVGAFLGCVITAWIMSRIYDRG